MSRADTLAVLAKAPTFDLAIIGGGATGLGVALDAAIRGYSVVLLESNDFAGGTSSRSTKLLHGGVRYLAQGSVSLVREALRERSAILRSAPHLCTPLAFVMPSYVRWKIPFYGIGLKLYDLLAGKAGLGQTELLNHHATLALLPGVRAAGLCGGVKYWDAQFDDARLAVANARSAQLAGAIVLNYAKVEGLHRLPSGADNAKEADGACWVLEVSDQRSAWTSQLHARCVVNATGVWVDGVRALAGECKRPMVTPSQGVHLVVERSFLAGENALLVPKTQDDRVLFAVPWLGSVILGTTDTQRADAPREPQAYEAEIAFILREAAHVLERAPQRSDVRSIWVGLRPLVRPGENKATRAISREHTIDISAQGLVTVTGGKWTTYRVMAKDVLSEIEHAHLLDKPSFQGLGEQVLVGGGRVDNQSKKSITQAPGWHLFGDEAFAVQSLQGAEDTLGMGLTVAMVRHMVRNEFACTVEDILARRWRALFLDACQARAMAARVAAIVSEETGEDPALDTFLALCDHYTLSQSDTA